MSWRFILVGLTLIGTSLRAQEKPPSPPPVRPPGVTDSSIAWGKQLFHGSANCSACHGEAGRGTDRGPNLTGAIWLHGDGSYQSLIQQVLHGVPAERSMSGEPMPIRGWVPMNDADVRAVAAYVWSISHPPQPPPPPKAERSMQ
jgi:mono/diheme cytochrome c family protein